MDRKSCNLRQPPRNTAGISGLRMENKFETTQGATVGSFEKPMVAHCSAHAVLPCGRSTDPELISASDWKVALW